MPSENMARQHLMRGRNWFAFFAYFCYTLCTALCTRYFLREGKGMRCGRKYAGYDKGKRVEADRTVCRAGIPQSGVPAALQYGGRADRRLTVRLNSFNVKQLYVFRDMKLVRLVPCCTITTQQDQIIRVLLGQFLEKYVHTSRIAIRNNKKTGASRYWFNSSVCIPIFANVMARYRWTNALFTPAVFGLIDSSESCFILEHKSYFLMWMTRLVYIIL